MGFLETHDQAPIEEDKSTSAYYQLIKLFMEPAETLPKFDLETQFALVKKLNVFLNLDDQAADKICKEFADKLTKYGMYEGAIYVCEHLSSEQESSEKITAIIDAHIDELGFLNDASALKRLNHSLRISMDFLNKARARRFTANEEFESAVKALIIGHSLEKAHKLAVEKVAPQYVIQETGLRQLQELLEHFSSVPGWSTGGKIYSDYVLLREYKRTGNEEEIKELVPQLINELQLLEEVNFNVKVAKTMMYKQLISTVFKYQIDVAASELETLQLPPSEANYLKNKLPNGGNTKLLADGK